MKNINFFGTTETEEPSLNMSWVDNLQVGNIIITKRLSTRMINELVKEDIQNKVILHLTCTGLSGTPFEPLTPSPEITKKKLLELLALGFPINQVVLRVDPIIPTDEGIEKMLYVLELFKEVGLKRVRFSIIDMYRHTIKRFGDAKIPLPFKGFHAPLCQQKKVVDAILGHKKDNGLTWGVECCAEVNVSDKDVIHCGCVSQKDVDVLGLGGKIELVGVGDGKQRKSCLCPSNKKNIMRGKPHQCDNKCTYCFWQ